MQTSPINHYAAYKMIVQVQLYFITVVQMLNQGTIRFRAVIRNRGPFSFFLDKQKEKEKTNISLVPRDDSNAEQQNKHHQYDIKSTLKKTNTFAT